MNLPLLAKLLVCLGNTAACEPVISGMSSYQMEVFIKMLKAAETRTYRLEMIDSAPHQFTVDVAACCADTIQNALPIRPV